MEKRHVVITGYGAVSSLGEGGAWSGLPQDSAATSWTAHDAEVGTRTYAVGNLRAERFVEENKLRRIDRFSQMAIVATELALKDSGLKMEGNKRDRTGVVFNTCYGPLSSTETYVTKLLREGPRKASAAIFPYTVQNAFTGLVTTHLRALGTNSTISGANPAAYGFNAIQQGTDDVMVVGGCEELTRSLVHGLRYQPFAKTISAIFSMAAAWAGPETGEEGFSGLGEGAAVVILEEEQYALARGAVPVARVVDYGSRHAPVQAARASDQISVAIEGALRQCLERAEFEAATVDLLVASAQHKANLESLESAAIRKVFGESGPRVIHPMQHLGNTLGASGMFNLLAACEEIRETTRGFDEGCERGGTKRRGSRGVDRVLVGDVQMGGNVSVLALERYGFQNNGRGEYVV